MRELEVRCTLILGSPDEINELQRNADGARNTSFAGGTGVQAVSFTDTAANKIYLSWPPLSRDNPAYEYAMDQRVLLHALGYEMTNLLHLDTDPLGR